METDESKKGYIRVSHLVYIIIIAVIVLAFFLVFALGDTKTASTTIGTASTVSSLILSVIAIVMTLIDVAGQRQSMFDLKETADKLKDSNESAASLFLELKTEIVDLQDTKQKMLEAVAESDEWKKELIAIVGKLESVQNSDSQNEDIDKIISEVNEKKFELLLRNLELTRDRARDAADMVVDKKRNSIAKRLPTKNNLLKFLRDEYKKGDQISIVDFRLIIHTEFGFDLETIQDLEKELVNSGFLRKVLDRPGYIEFT